VSKSKAASSIDSTACALRKMSQKAENGALLGGEGALTAKLGTSRATLRQAARLLEREGLLRVRRGIRGGYFAARPGFNAVEYAVAVYLESLDVDPEETVIVASILWVEVMRKAAGVRTEDAKALVENFRRRIFALRLNASWDDAHEMERDYRKAIFDLVESPYIELIFNINFAFAHKMGFPDPADRDGTTEHREFLRRWRQAKLMEIEAIAEGDQELAVMAARHNRSLWGRRVWGRDSELARLASSESAVG
jgi:DNA-binding FadR family transcriptional regulator